MTEPQFLAAFAIGIFLLAIFIQKCFWNAPEPKKKVAEPDDTPICGKCLFPFEPGKNYCGACIYVKYPDGITRQQIEAHVEAAHKIKEK